jgi:methyl-accepting chemotaxis protein
MKISTKTIADQWQSQLQFNELVQLNEKAGQMIQQLTTALLKATEQLTTATQEINNLTSLIEKLSKDNLLLVAKVDALTGKQAPGTTFAA